MDFVGYVKKSFELVKLNAASADELSKDNDAFLMGLIFVALAGVAIGIGTLNILGIFVLPVVWVIFSFIGAGILFILAKMFGGKAGFIETYRPLALGSIIMWIAVVPLVGPVILWLAEIWYMVMNVIIIRQVHQLTTAKAVMVVLIPIIVCGIIGLIIATIAATIFFGTLGALVTHG